MKQETAVEWIEYQVQQQGITHYFSLREILEQAKEMEKEQNKNYLKSYFEWHKSMGFVSHKPEDIIEFNETYGGKK
jgi:hypothetical protein